MNQWSFCVGEAIKHLLVVIKSGPQILFFILMSSALASFFTWLVPELFEELPLWVVPTLYLTVLLSLGAFSATVLWQMSFMAWRTYGVALLNRRKEQSQFQNLKQNLLGIGIVELFELSRALAKSSRELLLNPDDPVCIVLLSRGLISDRNTGFARTLSYVPNFEITMAAWTLMLQMTEFTIQDPDEFERQMNRRQPIRNLVPFLPQSHPAVVSVIKETDGQA